MRYIIKHEAVPDCGSFEVCFSDGLATTIRAVAFGQTISLASKH